MTNQPASDTPTPRTDALINRLKHFWYMGVSCSVEIANFCKVLERELTRLSSEREKEREGYRQIADGLDAAVEINNTHCETIAALTTKQLALEAQCQRMRDCIDRMTRFEDLTDGALNDCNKVAEAPLDLELLNRVRTEAKAIDSICQAEMQPFDNEGVPQFDPVIEKIMEHTDALLKSLSPAP